MLQKWKSSTRRVDLRDVITGENICLRPGFRLPGINRKQKNGYTKDEVAYMNMFIN